MVKMTSSDEHRECPLCMDALDLDDLNFYPCACHYQVCRFCWSKLINEENGLCPNCRKPYNSEEPAEFKPATDEEVVKRKKERKKIEQQKKQRTAETRKHLSDVRVLQKNLVFVTNLPIRLSDKEALKGSEYFGKYGKVYKVIINKNTLATNQNPQQQTVGAYVTYQRWEDALRAIIELNRLHIDGRNLKASLGTTKYCSHFLRGTPCNKHECMYLHEYGEDAASFTKEEMSLSKHTEYEARLIDNFQATMNAAAATASVAMSNLSSGVGVGSSIPHGDGQLQQHPVENGIGGQDQERNGGVDQTNSNNSRFSPGQIELSMSPYQQHNQEASLSDINLTGGSSSSHHLYSGMNGFDRAPGSLGNHHHHYNHQEGGIEDDREELYQDNDDEEGPEEDEDDLTLDFDPVSEAQHGLALAMESEGRQQQLLHQQHQQMLHQQHQMWRMADVPPGYHRSPVGGVASGFSTAGIGGGFGGGMMSPQHPHQISQHARHAFDMAGLQRSLPPPSGQYPMMEPPGLSGFNQQQHPHANSPPVHSFTPPGADPYRPPSQNSPARGQSWLYPAGNSFGGNSLSQSPSQQPPLPSLQQNGCYPSSAASPPSRNGVDSSINCLPTSTPSTRPSWRFQVQTQPSQHNSCPFPSTLSTKMAPIFPQIRPPPTQQPHSNNSCWSSIGPLDGGSSVTTASSSSSSSLGNGNSGQNHNLFPISQHHNHHYHHLNQMMLRDSLTSQQPSSSNLSSTQYTQDRFLSTTADTAISAAFSVIQ